MKKESQVFEISIIGTGIIAGSEPPYFTSDLKDITVSVGDIVNYGLPGYENPSGYEVTISI